MNQSEQSIFRALATAFPAPAHTLLSQVRNGTGFGRGRVRTADALVVSTFPSRGLWLGGVEIKVYLGDWKRELADAGKAEAIAQYCHRWYIAAPKGLIPKNELPATWGLVEVNNGKAKVTVKPKDMQPKALDMLLLCSILRNVGEGTVPKSEIDKLADARAEQMATHLSRELTQLREAVAEFEAASGVSLAQTWDFGDIGKAVKFVRSAHLDYHHQQLDKLRMQAQFIIDGCDKITAAMTQGESNESDR